MSQANAIRALVCWCFCFYPFSIFLGTLLMRSFAVNLATQSMFVVAKEYVSATSAPSQLSTFQLMKFFPETRTDTHTNVHKLVCVCMRVGVCVCVCVGLRGCGFCWHHVVLVTGVISILANNLAVPSYPLCQLDEVNWAGGWVTNCNGKSKYGHLKGASCQVPGGPRKAIYSHSTCKVGCNQRVHVRRMYDKCRQSVCHSVIQLYLPVRVTVCLCARNLVCNSSVSGNNKLETRLHSHTHTLVRHPASITQHSWMPTLINSFNTVSIFGPAPDIHSPIE